MDVTGLDVDRLGAARQRRGAAVLIGCAALCGLDEPTAALDLKHQIKLMGLLKRLAGEGWGVAAVLHDLHLVSTYADEAVLFKDGAVVGAGPVAGQLTTERVQDIFDLDEPYAMAG